MQTPKDSRTPAASEAEIRSMAKQQNRVFLRSTAREGKRLWFLNKHGAKSDIMNARKEGQIPFSSPSPPFPLPSKGQLRFQRSSLSRLQWRVLSAFACPPCWLPVSRPRRARIGDKDSSFNLPACYLWLQKNKHYCLSLCVSLVFLSLRHTILIRPSHGDTSWLHVRMTRKQLSQN